MSTTSWGNVGYGVYLDQLKEEYIDPKKLLALLKSSEPVINDHSFEDIFHFTENLSAEELQAAETAETWKLLEIIAPAIENAERTLEDFCYYYTYDTLATIIFCLLHRLGYEPADGDQSLEAFIIYACMPWEMGERKNLTREQADLSLVQALRKIYKDDCYDQIPAPDYINITSWG